MQRAYIIDGVRTAVGKFTGSLSSIRTDDLLAHVLTKLLERNPNLPAASIDDVIIGCANQAGEDNRNVARMGLLLAGIPWSVPGETVNRLCASGMSAAIHASRAISHGDGNVFLAGGVENMTRGPWVISKVSSPYGRDAEMHDTSFGWRFVNPKMHALYGTESMGETAENLVKKYKISREDQDYFSWQSHLKASYANSRGRLAKEIIPIKIKKSKKEIVSFQHDEFIRPDTTLDVLATLKPAFSGEGTVTAGNASGLNDGAAALIIASDEGVKNHDLQPMTAIVSSAVVGVEPGYMGIGPVYASQKALQKADLHLDDMDIIEINEAFAAQVLACTRLLNVEDNDARINPNGGAIAIGHPLGMSGARLLLTASHELLERKEKYALVTMCVGVGQGYAVILKNCQL